MPNKNELLARQCVSSARTELETAQHVGGVILLLAGAGFLQLVFTLDRVVDFSRFAY